MRSEETINVHVFNVGAGDHIMIELPDGSFGIIDCFFQEQNLGLTEIPAIAYLRHISNLKKQIQDNTPIRISFLCISHADSDHITGLDLLLDFILNRKNNIELENLWLFGGLEIRDYIANAMTILRSPLKTLKGDAKERLRAWIADYKSKLACIEKFRTKWQGKYKNTDGRSEQYFDSIKPITLFGEQPMYQAYSLGPSSGKARKYSEGEFKHFFRFVMKNIKQFKDLNLKSIDFSQANHVDRNNVSTILGLKSGGYVFHFGGDASSKTWESSLKQIRHSSWRDENLLHPDFIKASHHGAGHSSSIRMWEDLFDEDNKPVYVGISAGNKHRHPTDKFYKEFTECCKKKGLTPAIFRTNECRNCPSGQNAIPTNWYEHSKNRLKKIYGLEVMEVLDNYLPRNKKGQPTVDKNCDNLMAYIFEFPTKRIGNGVKVYRGVSNQIGTYDGCVLNGSKYYCLLKRPDDQAG